MGKMLSVKTTEIYIQFGNLRSFRSSGRRFFSFFLVCRPVEIFELKKHQNAAKCYQRNLHYCPDRSP